MAGTRKDLKNLFFFIDNFQIIQYIRDIIFLSYI